MSGDRPVFQQVNLIVRDLDATLAFYRTLGVELPDPHEWPAGSGAHHGQVDAPGGGADFELDDEPMAAIWHAGWRDQGDGRTGREPAPRTVVSFGLSSREAVDEAHDRLVAGGAESRQPPYDAFWGARYAIVADPDGNDVGLMSPIDRSHGYVPEPWAPPSRP